jgi:Zn-dependent protease
MRMSWRIGRILGVDIGLHYSWAIIGAWILFALAIEFHIAYPAWNSGALWAGALLTALLFFLCLLGHELAHAVVGNRRGVGVRSITLFALGGIAQADRDSPDASSEFWIAIAGPLASFAIGAACMGAGYLAGWQPLLPPPTPAVSIPVLLGFVNLWLAVFNLIPAFPLDGGRVLRAAIWGVTKSPERSLLLSARTSRWIAMTFIATGVIRFFMTGAFAWLWLALIGWFVLSAAGAAYNHAQVSGALQGVRVRDIMPEECPMVDRNMNLRDFVLSHIAEGDSMCVLVQNAEGEPGIVTAREVGEVPRPQWPYRTVGDVMRPIGEDQTVSADLPVMDALERMGRENVMQLAVADNGRFEGIISRSDVVGFIAMRGGLERGGAGHNNRQA